MTHSVLFHILMVQISESTDKNLIAIRWPVFLSHLPYLVVSIEKKSVLIYTFLTIIGFNPLNFEKAVYLLLE